MKPSLLTIFFCFCVFAASAQKYYTLRGYVYSENNEAIVNANVRIVNANTGTITTKDGKYEIQLLEGLNRISVSSVGYQTEMFEVVADKNLVKNIFLKVDTKQIDEVVVRIKKKDYSYEVIKNVIENKSLVLNQYKNYKSKVYVKSVESFEKKPEKKKETEDPPKADDPLATTEKTAPKKDSIPNLNIFECQLIRHESSLGQQKEERDAVKKIGSQGTLFFKSITDGEFNLYRNLQKMPKIGDNAITSPLSELTFLSYKFHLLKYSIEGKDKIYTIQVIPREAGNALYEGVIEVYEDLWVLKQ